VTARPIVVYDANVLYPAQLRDLLMRLAVAGLVRAHGSDQIHAEWMAHVCARHPDVRREQLERTRVLTEHALPSARVEGYERHVASISLPDPADRHVVAAAIEAEAQAVVTFNLRDFPHEVLKPHGLRAVHPDAFVVSLYEAHPDPVVQVMHAHRISLRRPLKSPEEYLAELARGGLTQTVTAVRAVTPSCNHSRPVPLSLRERFIAEQFTIHERKSKAIGSCSPRKNTRRVLSTRL